MIFKELLKAALIMGLGIGFLSWAISHNIEEAGGFKNIIIEAGKDINEIQAEIEKGR